MNFHPVLVESKCPKYRKPGRPLKGDPNITTRSLPNDDDEQGRINRAIVQIKNTIPKIATDSI